MAVISATSLLVGSAILGGAAMGVGAIQQRNMRRQQADALRKAEEDARIQAANANALSDGENKEAEVVLGRRRGKAAAGAQNSNAANKSVQSGALSSQIGGLGSPSSRLGL